jgi:peptidoglycan/xylan/chitin deacetylase (PgdA/CDA1 family)
MRFGVFHKGTSKNQVAFTFDDGPHPRYTPELLDLLQDYQVKATFFVLGSQADLHPDLIRRMHREGHQIGIHNYNHTSNWLMLPWTVRRDHMERTADIIESIIGKRPDHYRPPETSSLRRSGT